MVSASSTAGPRRVVHQQRNRRDRGAARRRLALPPRLRPPAIRGQVRHPPETRTYPERRKAPETRRSKNSGRARGDSFSPRGRLGPNLQSTKRPAHTPPQRGNRAADFANRERFRLPSVATSIAFWALYSGAVACASIAGFSLLRGARDTQPIAGEFRCFPPNRSGSDIDDGGGSLGGGSGGRGTAGSVGGRHRFATA